MAGIYGDWESRLSPSPSNVYPTLADGVVVAGGAAWKLGNFVEIIPADTINKPYDIRQIIVESSTAADTYEIVLYAGALGEEAEIGRVRSYEDTAVSGSHGVPIQTPVLSAGTRVSAKVASKSGGDSLTISLIYN